MAYSDTQVFTLDAATTSLADIMAALIAHFTSAPGRWELKSSFADEAMVIRAKTAPTSDVALRREGTSTLNVTVAPDSDISDPGDATTAPTVDGVNGSPEGKTTLGTISTRLFVIEYDQAVCIVFQDSTKAFTPQAIHAGLIMKPARDNDANLGIDGHGFLVGDVDNSGTPCWGTSAVQANGSRIRGFDESGAAGWHQLQLDDYPESNSSFTASVSDDGLIKSPRPLVVKALDVSGGNDLYVGSTLWVAAAPFDTTAFPAQNPRNIAQTSVDEAWMYIRDQASVTCLLTSWERGVSPT